MFLQKLSLVIWIQSPDYQPPSHHTLLGKGVEECTEEESEEESSLYSANMCFHLTPDLEAELILLKSLLSGQYIWADSDLFFCHLITHRG